MKKGMRIFWVLMFVLFASISFAQPVVSFDASAIEACAPAEITFTNTTTGCTGAATYYWLDGSGDNSNNENPTFYYNSGGTYTVSLEVTCDGFTESNTMEITIYDPPSAGFAETPLTGCVPYNASFNDESIEGDGPINGWQWYFGDGFSSTTQNPSHPYTTGGSFNVSLIITDVNDCTDEYTSNGLVSVANLPVVSFTADEPYMCYTPHTVEFTASVTTSFGLGYTLEWDFGDGSPTGSGSPASHEYTVDGLYDVSLTATDEYGCETTVVYTDFVQLTTATPEYTVLEGDIVCKDQPVHFQNETSYSCSWDFGDGSPTSYNPTPEHIYSASGDYEVTFTVDPGGTCEASTSFTLTVEEVTASFTTDPTNLYSCTVPFEVDFSSTVSANVTGYFWVFQDGGSSNEANPTYTFNSVGSWPVALTVTTEHGCAYTSFGPVVTINVPDASFTADEIEGCEPLTVNFTYTGTTPQPSIEDYSWDFNNGQTISGGGPAESSTFDAGEYTVTLTITDDQGCIGTSTVDLNIGTVYEPDIDVFNNDEDHTVLEDHYICAQDTMALWLAEWDWEDYEFTWWIDSSQNQQASQEYTEYAFDQDTGWYDLNIITLYNGCRDTIYWDSLHVDGPIINSISNSTDCASPLDFVFTLNETEAEYWHWEFYYWSGDTQIMIEEEDPSTNNIYPITFPAQQSYWCRVTAYNSITSCEFVDSVEISISAPQAIFTLIDDEICAETPLILNGGSSLNVSEYYWDYGDGQNSGWVTESAVQHVWNNTGWYTITLTVRDGNGCENSITDDIHILGPDIDINVSDTFGCNSLNVTFTDNSVADEAIIQVLWDFNNGDQLNGSIVEYTYDEVGTYDVTVYVQTASGCLADTTYFDLITIASVNAAFAAPNQIACVGDELTFNAGETDPSYVYSWNFGEGAPLVGNNPNPTHTYTSGGYFDVTLNVDNLLGCTDEITYEDFIIVQDPTANFSLGDNTLSCYPAAPDIIQNSSVLPPETILTYQWIMGNNDTVNVEDPDYLYTMPGTYDIVLNIETSAGCTDTYTQQLIVEGPYADRNISTHDACVDEPVYFELTDMNDVIDYNWVVGGGDAYDLTSFEHSYDIIPVDGYYIANLTLTSGPFCTVYFTDTIYIHDVYAGILLTDPDAVVIDGGACAPYDALLTSDSEGDDFITWWVDGDEYGTGLGSQPITFENNGTEDLTVDIELTIEDAFGCTDTATTSIEVWAVPQVTIHKDTIICYGDELAIYATGGTSYNWTPNSAISDVNSATPSVSPTENTMYTVMVYNDHLCEGTDSVYITVMQEPNITLTPEIDSIMIGDSVYSLLVADQENLTYLWTPQSHISCYDCPMPVFYPEEDTRYNLTVEDSMKCFRHNYFIDIIVREEYSLDVPMAFTPLGNDGNKVVYVKGFGIKNLLQFRIFNRWGEEVFYTDDINQGWDGYYKGQLQNIDNYSYYVEAEMYDGSVRTKKGYIMLIR